MRSTLSVRGSILATNSTASLAFANDADARELLPALRADPHTVAAALYDRNGRLFATYPGDLPGGALPAAPGPDGYRFQRGNLIGFQPVAEAGGQRLGTLYLASDLAAVDATLRLSGVIAVAVLTVALLAAYLLSRVLQGAISQPVLMLAETARAVSDRRDYSVRAAKLGEDELGVLTDAFNHMLSRIEAQDRALRESKEGLEQRVAERTHELEERNEALRHNAAQLLAANTELDAFAYSVSHDLRAPLRSIDGFSQVLLEDYAAQLDEAGRDSLRRVRAAPHRMGTLLDDPLQRAPPDRQVEFAIAQGLEARGDARLLRVALENLLGNSWKYTAKRTKPKIEFGSIEENGGRAFLVRDNGAGFDMRYAGPVVAD